MEARLKIQAQRQKLAAQIAALKSPHPLRVGIDGITASGKTTFADELASLIRALGRPVVRTTIDGYYNPKEVRYRTDADSPESYYKDSFNYPALRKGLLEPLADIRADIRAEARSLPVAAYDFRKECAVTDQTAEFEPATVLLFEGVMLFREEINDCWDYRIFVDARMETAFTRGVPRDAGTEDRQMAVGERYLSRYFPGQRAYLAKIRPTDMADVVIFNDDVNTSHIRYKKT